MPPTLDDNVTRYPDWHGFSISWNRGGRHGYGRWIAICRYHLRYTGSLCTRSRHIRGLSQEDRMETLCQVRQWCLNAIFYSHQRNHIVDDFPAEMVMPWALQEEEAARMPPPADPLLRDDEVDRGHIDECNRLYGNAPGPKPKAPKTTTKKKKKKAPQPKAKTKAKAKAKRRAVKSKKKSSASSKSGSPSSSDSSSIGSNSTKKASSSDDSGSKKSSSDDSRPKKRSCSNDSGPPTKKSRSSNSSSSSSSSDKANFMCYCILSVVYCACCCLVCRHWLCQVHACVCVQMRVCVHAWVCVCTRVLHALKLRIVQITMYFPVLRIFGLWIFRT